MITLPKVDENGEQYISYSQINTFKRSKQEYFNRYIKGEPFVDNPWTLFGSKVGESLELNNFNGFSQREKEILRQVPRLDEFEVEIRLQYEEFYVKGYIDTTDYETIIDYKTGSAKKKVEYMRDDYWQIQIYALALQQEGFSPKEGKVVFIERYGNPYRGQVLEVGQDITEIPVDISPTRLESVYEGVYGVAKEISDFYISVTQFNFD